MRLFISKNELKTITIKEHQFNDRDYTVLYIKKNREILL
jgi:hypothetical protein